MTFVSPFLTDSDFINKSRWSFDVDLGNCSSVECKRGVCVDQSTQRSYCECPSIYTGKMISQRYSGFSCLLIEVDGKEFKYFE